jgi:hypothetical protein
MATLTRAVSGKTLTLTLRGADEDRILATVRRWPYWDEVSIERDPADADHILSITLHTDRANEATLRAILERSFGMTFPAEGGDCAPDAAEPPPPVRRRRY